MPETSKPEGVIPQSSALAEAAEGGDSLSELWSRDPEHFREVDIERTVQVFRERRVPWAQAEVERASGKAPRKSKAEMLATKSGIPAGDLGL